MLVLKSARMGPIMSFIRCTIPCNSTASHATTMVACVQNTANSHDTITVTMYIGLSNKSTMYQKGRLSKTQCLFVGRPMMQQFVNAVKLIT